MNSMVPLLFNKSGVQLYLHDTASKEAVEMSEPDVARSTVGQGL